MIKFDITSSNYSQFPKIIINFPTKRICYSFILRFFKSKFHYFFTALVKMPQSHNCIFCVSVSQGLFLAHFSILEMVYLIAHRNFIIYFEKVAFDWLTLALKKYIFKGFSNYDCLSAAIFLKQYLAKIFEICFYWIECIWKGTHFQNTS